MRFEDSPEEKRKRRKGKLLMALICGPIFALLFIVLMIVFSILGEVLNMNLSFLRWGAIAGAGGGVATAADKLGKRFGLTAQQFAAPVAFSSVVCGIAIFTLLGFVAACINA